jgi:hypothetical protein
MSDDFNDASIVDGARSHCLCTAGAPGWAAVVVVDSEGRENFALADIAAIDDVAVEFDPQCRDTVPHEQLGALPLHVWLKVWENV